MQQPTNVSMNMMVKDNFHESAFRSRQHWVMFYSYVLGLFVRSLERIKKCAKAEKVRKKLSEIYSANILINATTLTD